MGVILFLCQHPMTLALIWSKIVLTVNLHPTIPILIPVLRREI